jgi:Putative phage tail protein
VLAGTIVTVAQVGLLAASIVVSQQQASRQRRKAIDEYNRSLRDQMVTLKGGVNPRPLIYGRTCVGGQLIYAETYGSRKENLLLVIAMAHGESDAIETVYFNDIALTIDGSNNVTTAPYYIDAANRADNFIQQATVPGSPYQVALTHEQLGNFFIQDISNGMGGGDGGAPPILTYGVDYTLTGTTVTFAAAMVGRSVQMNYVYSLGAYSFAKVWKLLGSPTQDISSTMIALGAPSWTSADKCNGMTGLIVQLTFAENMWESGIPNIKAVIRGRRVLDPRSSTTAWTANAALCARDYLTFQYGVNAASGKIDDTNATNGAANICDEDVQLTSGPATYQDRYTFDGIISTGDDRNTNLNLFEQALGGSINYSAGKWRIRAGAYTAPALTLDEGKLSDKGAIQIVPFTSRRDLINGAKGTFINDAKGWVEDQFPEWSSATFITEDGGAALTTAITLPQVTDVSRAQRLAKIAVYRAREQLTLAVTCNFSTYAWQVGDMVSVNLARYGFSAKPFRITRRGMSVEGGMTFMLREEPNGIYDWNLGEASILTGAGNTTLPNPASVGVPTITGITSAQWLYKAGDGTFVARIRVAVTPPADEYVQKGGKLQLQYKRGDWSGDWTLVEADGAATAIWIDPAFDAQNYLIRVRAVNSAGFASAWTPMEVHTCQGRPGQIVNLLLNADWTEDLGYGQGAYFTDTRSLRSWVAGGTTPTPIYGRNYAGGKQWNAGLGGAWMLNNSTTNGQYQYFGQWVPVSAALEFELQVRCSIHRQFAYVAVNWLNAARDTILGSISDGLDSGNGVVGDASNPSNNPFFWCKGVAPANAEWALVHCLMQNTAATGTPGYTFWQRAMFNLAPSGVTRETATPWVPDALSTVTGQRIDEYTGNYPTPVEYSGFNGQLYDQVPHYFYFTPRATGMADVEIMIDVSPWGGSGIYGNGIEAAAMVGQAFGWPTGRNIGERAVSWSQNFNNAMSITLTASLPVTAGVGYYAVPGFWAYATGGISWTVRRVAYSVRCIRRT